MHHPDVATALEQAAAAVLQRDPELAYQKLVNFPIARDEAHFDQGWPVRLRFETGAELLQALQARDPTVFTFALQLLAAFEPETAVRLALPLPALAKEALTGRFDAFAVRSAAQVLNEQVKHVPLDKAIELGAEGVIERYAAPDLLHHPSLQGEAARSTLFADINGGRYGDGGFIADLTQSLVLTLLPGEPAAVQWVLDRWHEPDHPSRDMLFSWLQNAGCQEAIATLASAAEEVLQNPDAPAHQRDGVVRALLLTDADRAAAVLPKRVLQNDSASLLDKDSLIRHKLLDAVYAGTVSKKHTEWIAALIDVLALPALADAAKELLSAMDKKAVKQALKLAGVKAASGEPERRAPVPQKIDFLARYQAGEHEAVWDALYALGATVRDPAVEPQARAVALETMKRARTSVEQIVKALKKSKYNFMTSRPLAPAKKTASKQLATLEKQLGGPLPLSLHAFYEVFGAVDLREDPNGLVDNYTLHEEVGRSNPLVVLPLKQVAADLKQQRTHNKKLLPELRDPPSAYLAPDPQCKYDPDDTFPDSEPLRLLLPDNSADAVVRSRDGAMHFVQYLRAFIQNGGFLGLSETHDRQALDVLRAGVVAF